MKQQEHWRVLSAGDNEERLRLKSRRNERAWFGAPGWNRTSDPQLRRLMLYPTELRARSIEKVLRTECFGLSLEDRLRPSKTQHLTSTSLN
jgi:hypothetical protein